MKFKNNKIIKEHNIKIFIGLKEVAGYYTSLKKGFQQLGVECIFVNLDEDVFSYGGSDANKIVRLVIWSRKKCAGVPKKSFLIKILFLLIKILFLAFQKLISILFFIYALKKYDVFIFASHSTFLRFYDLPILKLAGKKIIYVFHGSDSRPPYLNGAFVPDEKGFGLDDLIRKTYEIKTKLRRIEKYADVIINSPPQTHFHQKQCVSWLIIGIPTESSGRVTGDGQRIPIGNTVRILHAPSLPKAKGTYEFRQIIEMLKKKGYKIDYVEVTGLPNQTVLDELTRCDFVIDELYSDTPMAGFAAEAAIFGKPAIIGSYCTEIKKDLPSDKIPPSIFCHPDKIAAEIEKLIVDKNLRCRLGKQAKDFINKHWLPKHVAQRYMQVINENFPKEWLFSPGSVRYLHGWGLSEKKAKSIVRSIVDTGGIEALCLSDKPNLEKLFLQFAGFEK